MHHPLPVDGLEGQSDHVEESSGNRPWGVFAVVVILLIALAVAVLAYSGPAEQPAEPVPSESPIYP